MTQALTLPLGGKRLLLHSCCAPCGCDIMELIADAGIDYTIFFYNPNIHPHQEYLARKAENMRFAKQLGVPFIDGDYDKKAWFERTEGMGDEPERGRRCTSCFDMRFEVTAQKAFEEGYDTICSTLGISRWKNMQQINECGFRAAAQYPGMRYWTYNWRKEGGAARMVEKTHAEGFYQQQYCGCVYSLRDTNQRRLAAGRQRIKLGTSQLGNGAESKNEFHQPPTHETAQLAPNDGDR